MNPLIIAPLLFTFAGRQAPVAPGRSQEASAPFSFYLVPSDVLGFKDCPNGFQVTYDGSINNGFGELDLFAGDDLRPIDQRVKTLHRGHYPIVEYSFTREGATYHVESFSAPSNLDPRENLIAFVRVTVSNAGKVPVDAHVAAKFGPRKDFARSSVDCRPWYQAKFMDDGLFKSALVDSIQNGAVTRGGHLLYLYSGTPQIYSKLGEVAYDIPLKPGQSESVEFKIPFVPERPEFIATTQAMGYGDYFTRTIRFWDGIARKAMSVDLNDPKVIDAMRTNLIYDLIARDIEADGKHFTQTVNKFQYHGFFMRDTSFIAHSYDLLNLPEVARETIERYLIRDESGHVVKFRRESPDDWGQSLWAVGAHFRATGDLAFAREVHAAIAPHLDEFVRSTSTDPLHLWPVAGPYDNELIDGHYTSHNLWALLGLSEAENLSRAVGDSANAERAHRYYVAFRKTFVNRLALLTAKDQGYIPPGMDDPLAGYDWENASGGVYPFRVFPPDHPWVTATVNMEREYKYREGIMTWGPNAWAGKVAAMKGADFDPNFLHDYDTFQVDETLLARGEQQKVVEDLYSTLVHTSSTHGGFETSIRPWGNRDPDGNYPPHGWFAARYNELVRNMLVREDGNALHLFSAVAPKWLERGHLIRVQRAATTFGNLDFEMTPSPSGLKIGIHPKWRSKPRRLVVHLPWFASATGARADHRRVTIKDNAVWLDPDVRELTVDCRLNPIPGLSYERAVQLWLQKAYAPKPGEDTDHLFATNSRPRLGDPDTTFVDKYVLTIRSTTNSGTIRYTLDGSMPSHKSKRYVGPVTLTKSAVIRAIEFASGGTQSEELTTQVTKASYVPATGIQDAAPGIAYDYYEGAITQMPKFDALTPTRSSVALTGALEEIPHRSEIFALRERGYISIAKKGIYTFWTGSDDGSNLWIDDRLVVSNDGPHAYKEVHGKIALAPGPHRIRIEYFDSGGANYLRLFWAGPGFAKRGFAANSIYH